MDRRSAKQRGSEDPVARYLGSLQAEVMETFWQRGSLTVRELVDELNQSRRLAYTTVLTLTSRLWARGFLTREPEGRGFRYRPATTRQEFLADLSDQLIGRLFSDFGELGVAHLSERFDAIGAERADRLRRAGGR